MGRSTASPDQHRTGIRTQNILTGAAGAAALGIGYATLVERNAFTLRETTLPVLEPGASTLKVLHLSDLHMMPNQRLKQQWLRELERLDPDLVINTGDNLSHPKAVPAVVQSLGGLLSRPGFFVFGSNDYFAPVPKNPFGTTKEWQPSSPLPDRNRHAPRTIQCSTPTWPGPDVVRATLDFRSRSM